MVQAVMDQDWADHGRRYSKASRDRNAYTTGVIGRHNVVLVHMPGMGNTSSASVATDLRSSFQDIEIVFVVGICGIVPIKPETKDEIVLGDCIISTSVVQYDNGRCFPEGFAQKKGTEDILGRANPVIRALIAKLTTITNWARLTNQLAASLRGLRASPHKITYPGTARDKLFDTKYIHQHHGSDSRCDKCVPNKNTCTRDCETLRCEDVYLVNRERLSSSGLSLLYPRIHFGVFGSANTVMRSGQDRDDLSKEFGIIAFDMEGAGIWDQFPTIIIKAGCDYADSHKNKTWQKYAAASAASTLKAFLDELETSQESLSGNVDIDAGNLWVNQQHHIRARFPMPIGHPGQLQPQNYMGHRNFPEFSDSRIIQGLPGMSVGDMYAQRPMTTVYKTLGRAIALIEPRG